MRFQKLLLTFSLVFIFIFSGSVLADIYIKQVTHTDGFQMQGQTMEPRDDTVTMWLGKDMARSSSKEGTILFRIDKDTIYTIDDEKKSYSLMPLSALGDMKKMMNMEDMDEEEAKMMEQQMQMMMSMMQVSAKVTPTEEAKKINGYNCKKYLVDFKMAMANIKTDYWVSKDVDLDYDTFKKLNLSQMLFMPGADQMMEEFSKIDGFLVYSEGVMNVMGQEVKTTTTLIEIEQKSAPAGTFDIPNNYKREDFNPMSNMK